jgi:hypothetical protein
MLAFQANRGWNYQTSGAGGSNPLTITLHADDTSTGANAPAISQFVAPGLDSNAISATGSYVSSQVTVTLDTGAGYKLNNFINFYGTFPVNATLVPHTLTLGQTMTPYAGVSAVVTNIGIQPHESTCPVPTAAGAAVLYSGMGQNVTVSYVPGCGITDVVAPNGQDVALVSISTYSSLGTLSVRQQPLATTVWNAVHAAVRAVLNEH